nr:hypothetical protein [Tanacetum cinerariifolium]
MIECHSVDMRLKDLMMMVLVMYTNEYDIVLHMKKTGMWVLVVEIGVGGMTADVVDKLTCSSDGVQPRQVKKPKKEQNRIEIKKREAWRSREKSEADTVD